jgi:predicted transcriptional regulator
LAHLPATDFALAHRRKKAKGFDTRTGNSYLQGMEVSFTSDLQAKLARLAAQQGRDSNSLVVEAVERMVDYDEWFLREVEKGLAAADRDEFVEHEEIRKRLIAGISADADSLDGTCNG